MKKIILLSLIIATFLTIPCFAKSTSPRGLVEFCELYSSRMAVAKSLKGERYNIAGTVELEPIEMFGLLYVNTSAGTAFVDKDTFTIDEISLLFYDDSDDEKAQEDKAITVAIGASALEFDHNAELGYSIGIMDDPITRAYALWGDILDVISAKWDNITDAPNEEILVYTGNYDYYAQYFNYEDTVQYYLTARQRKE